MTNQYDDANENESEYSSAVDAAQKRLTRAKRHVTAAANVKPHMLGERLHAGKQEETPECFLEIFQQMMRNL